jgi:hypothetical protein
MTHELNQIYGSLNFVTYTNISMSMNESDFHILEEKSYEMYIINHKFTQGK